MGFKGDALFAYMVEEVADVMEYFKIDATNDLPVLVAHKPVYDHKFKSDRLNSLDAKTMVLAHTYTYLYMLIHTLLHIF